MSQVATGQDHDDVPSSWLAVPPGTARPAPGAPRTPRAPPAPHPGRSRRSATPIWHRPGCRASWALTGPERLTRLQGRDGLMKLLPQRSFGALGALPNRVNSPGQAPTRDISRPEKSRHLRNPDDDGTNTGGAAGPARITPELLTCDSGGRGPDAAWPGRPGPDRS